MVEVRKSEDRGYANHGWLESYHSFSFANYQNPKRMGFRALRVMNEDRVAPGKGFGTHSHANMEIVTYVLEGALEHKDSMGNGETLTPGEFQRISAGSGISHSEFNPSAESPTHFYQIWLLPDEQNLNPSYEQKAFDAEMLNTELRLVASPTAANGSLTIGSDAKIFLARAAEQQSIEYQIPAARHVWLQVLRGSVGFYDSKLSAGDAVAMSSESRLRFSMEKTAEVMLFDLA